MIYSSRKHEEESTMSGSLSARLRPNSECAPWVLDEIIKLEDKIRDMATERSELGVVEMNRRLDAIGKAIGLEPQKLAEDPEYARQALKDAYRRGAIAAREACAAELDRILTRKKATAIWVGADEIRATRLPEEP